MKSLILFLAFVGITVGSYCGQSGVPFSFESGPDGQPVLGCARPSCFGWNADGKRAADSAQFYRINKKPDGFLRSSDVQGPVITNATGFRPQFAFCDRAYNWNQCFGNNQWVGGIAPLPEINSESLFQVLCCTYERLSEATDQGIAQIRPGQAVVGGEIKGDDGRQYSFEYISNIQRSFDENKKVVYHVTMKRFPCLPEPVNQETQVEKGLPELLAENAKKDVKPENIQFAAKTIESGTPIRSFDQTKFDLPKDMPKEDSKPLEELPSETSQNPSETSQNPSKIPQNPSEIPQNPSETSQNPSEISQNPSKTPQNPSETSPQNGETVPCAKSYPEDQSTSQLQPVAIPQNPQNGVFTVQNYNSQPLPQYNYNYYQPNWLDPLGLFQQRTYVNPQNPVQTGVPQASSQQTYPQSQSYNPFWPFYSYSQNPSASYGVPTQVASVQPQPLAPSLPAQGSRTLSAPPHPRPVPLKIPSVEEVEQSIPESGRRMIVRVARTLLGL